jgi:hypothetical protein
LTPQNEIYNVKNRPGISKSGPIKFIEPIFKFITTHGSTKILKKDISKMPNGKIFKIYSAKGFTDLVFFKILFYETMGEIIC